MNEIRSATSDARSLNNDAPDDVRFESGVLLKLLSALRGSSIPKEERMLLRDLILEYSQADDSEKKATGAKLSAALAPHRAEFAPVLGSLVKTDSADPAPHNAKNAPLPGSKQSFGTSRRQPVFKVGITERPSVSSPDTKTDAMPDPAQLKQPEQEIPVVSEHKEGKQPQPAPVQQVPVSGNDNNAKARIAEIKRAVNERVGNPVNLIEKNRAVGQEYMSALLEAIKSGSGGGGTHTALLRLEAAYKAVMDLLDNEQPSANTVPQSKQGVKTQVEKPSAKDMAPEPMKTPVATPVSAHENDRSSSIPKESAAPKKEYSIPIRTIEVSQNRPSASQPLGGEADVQKIVPLNSLRTDADSETAATSVPLRESAAPRANVPIVEANAVSKVPEQEGRASTISASPTGVSTQTKGMAGDPTLYTPQVTAGLEQLLSEWKLFKSSGIFGTGPHGTQHPLYKQLAQLPMAAVIAGRFEGATPEIRQNIADYMNGWRYEHGLLHRMNEQFEQYLRRVIAHILKNQKK